MTAQTYRELCEAIRFIEGAAERQTVSNEPVLCEWRRWARGVLAGLYYAKTARRAARSAKREALLRCDSLQLIDLSSAAALAAIAVVRADENDELSARSLARRARGLCESVAAARWSRPGANAMKAEWTYWEATMQRSTGGMR